MATSSPGDGPSPKKPRYEWYEALVSSVRESTGSNVQPFVHECLTMDKDRTMRCMQTVPKDTILMKIHSNSQIKADKFNINGIDTAHPLQDCELAAILACTPDTPYTGSLPAKIQLARHWTKEDLSLLAPSPILKRIERSKEDVAKDYRSTLGVVAGGDPNITFDLESFDQGLAVVSSRAFDNNGHTTLVPLLDLCNHSRGSMSKKNTAYSFVEDGEYVVVRAFTDLQAGTALCITYGAQGNGPLLLNYGFCVEPNLEPDGSSNDTYELMDEKGRSIHLRTGGKSYTYGCFCSALEMFLEGNDDPDEYSGNNRGEPDDMEAFLNECDEEEDNMGFDEDDQDEPEEDADMEADEIEGLIKLGDRLSELRALYKNIPNEDDGVNHHLAGILLRSEIRTIYFYQLAAAVITKQLGKDPGSVTVPDFITKDDNSMIKEQVDELAKAYGVIRHSGML